MAHTIVGYPSRGQAPEIPAMRLNTSPSLGPVCNDSITSRMFGQWFNLPLKDITVRRVTEWRTKRLALGRKPSGINRDVNSLKVRDLLGHESIEMTLKYAHLAPQSTALAISVLNRRRVHPNLDIGALANKKA